MKPSINACPTCGTTIIGVNVARCPYCDTFLWARHSKRELKCIVEAIACQAIREDPERACYHLDISDALLQEVKDHLGIEEETEET